MYSYGLWGGRGLRLLFRLLRMPGLAAHYKQAVGRDCATVSGLIRWGRGDGTLGKCDIIVVDSGKMLGNWPAVGMRP